MAALLTNLGISIHAPREGGDSGGFLGQSIFQISIHAPREGGDYLLMKSALYGIIISIHAPREGGDAYFIVTLRAMK